MQVKQGQVIVRAPIFVKEAFINAFIKEKSVWLKSKIVAQQQAQASHFDFRHGSEILLFGNKVNLVIRSGKKGQVFSGHNINDSQKSCLTVIINARNAEGLIDAGTFSKQVKKQLEFY